MKVNKLLKGLRDIHFAIFSSGVYENPFKILFAKAIEMKLEYESEQEWADDGIADDSGQFAGGEGKLKILGLTKEEQALLFGNKKVKGGIAVYSTDSAPSGAFLFARGKKNSKHKRLYVIYNCKCSPNGFNGETVEEGKAPAEVCEIDFTVADLTDGLVYYYIDTDDPTVSQEQITNWFTEVQMPEELEAQPNVTKVDVAPEDAEETLKELITSKEIEEKPVKKIKE